MPDLCFNKYFNNFIKIETLAQVFSCEFREISTNTFLAEHVWATASKASTYNYHNKGFQNFFQNNLGWLFLLLIIIIGRWISAEFKGLFWFLCFCLLHIFLSSLLIKTKFIFKIQFHFISLVCSKYTVLRLFK